MKPSPYTTNSNVVRLKFTPLEFETVSLFRRARPGHQLKFTPLEFETWGTQLKSWHILLLKFTPLEFETLNTTVSKINPAKVKIYSVGVWNTGLISASHSNVKLKFTPLEFETRDRRAYKKLAKTLKFTPLEFETMTFTKKIKSLIVKIYSVGVWNVLQPSKA